MVHSDMPSSQLVASTSFLFLVYFQAWDTDQTRLYLMIFFSRFPKQSCLNRERNDVLKECFKSSTRKGYIEGHGIRRVLRRLHIDHTESDIDLMMKVADTKGDGRVDFEEFLQIFNDSDDI